MAIRVALNHKTGYRYDRPVELSPQIVRLRPARHARTPIISYSFQVAPDPQFLNWQQDPHGNYLARLVFPERVRSFEVEVDLIAELTAFTTGLEGQLSKLSHAVSNRYLIHAGPAHQLAEMRPG